MTSPNLDTITLTKGSHSARHEGLCLMEAVAWFAGKPHTDRPPCVSPVLGAYGRHLNDVLGDGPRQQLKPYIPRLPGTAGDGLDETRGFIALDWLTRTWLPAWLDLAGIDTSGLRGHARVDSLATATSIGPVVRLARDQASAVGDAARAAAGDAVGEAAVYAAGDAVGDAAVYAAGDAAWAAARDAARDAAWDAPWDAAGDAARDAAGDAARAAARAAARDAARAAARAAAWDAAVYAAWDAAVYAARAAARAAARDAARAAARAALGPVVTSLQQSAISLYANLITGTWPDEPVTP